MQHSAGEAAVAGAEDGGAEDEQGGRGDQRQRARGGLSTVTWHTALCFSITPVLDTFTICFCFLLKKILFKKKIILIAI